MVPYLGSMFQTSDDVGCLTLGHVLQSFGSSILIQCAFGSPFVNDGLLAIGCGRLPPFCSSKEPSSMSEKSTIQVQTEGYPSANDPRRTFCVAYVSQPRIALSRVSAVITNLFRMNGEIFNAFADGICIVASVNVAR